VFEGRGLITVNGKSIAEYLQGDIYASIAVLPLQILGLATKYDCRVDVLGGGKRGQLGAIQLGIARALLQINHEFRAKLREGGFLTRDARVKERKKYGRKKARKGFQFRKR
jgi:small subunit ribosomal protein S9